MKPLGARMHLLVLAAMVVNLWLGGDLVEAWAGHLVRSVFELALILAYLLAAWDLGFRGRRQRR